MSPDGELARLERLAAAAEARARRAARPREILAARAAAVAYRQRARELRAAGRARPQLQLVFSLPETPAERDGGS